MIGFPLQRAGLKISSRSRPIQRIAKTGVTSGNGLKVRSLVRHEGLLNMKRDLESQPLFDHGSARVHFASQLLTLIRGAVR